MGTTTTPRLDELAKLTGAREAAHARLNDTRRRAVEVANAVPGLKAQAGAAWAAGDEKAAEKHEKAAAAVEAEVRGTWQPRIVASEAAVTAADQATKAFLIEYGAEILREIEPDAEAVRERLVAALQEAVEASNAYAAEVGRQEAISGSPARFRGPNVDHISQLAARAEAELMNGIPSPAAIDTAPPPEPEDAPSEDASAEDVPAAA